VRLRWQRCESFSYSVWATDQAAGYPVTHWGPGGLIVLGASRRWPLAAVGLRAAEIPLTGKIALELPGRATRRSASSRFSGLPFPGDAWEGAKPDVAVPVLVFALFASLAPAGSQRGAAAGGVDARDDRAGGVLVAAARERRLERKAFSVCFRSGG